MSILEFSYRPVGSIHTSSAHLIVVYSIFWASWSRWLCASLGTELTDGLGLNWVDSNHSSCKRKAGRVEFRIVLFIWLSQKSELISIWGRSHAKAGWSDQFLDLGFLLHLYNGLSSKPQRGGEINQWLWFREELNDVFLQMTDQFRRLRIITTLIQPYEWAVCWNSH